MKTEIYTRQGCHLCEVAEQLLRNHGLTPTMIDIDADPDADPKLLADYNQCVPVVMIDGKVRFRGKVDPVLLKRLLAVED